ncbi:hypothetical protein R1flu_005663 [Riccia fluitans]|uniref:Phytocyanin domain-containing protein n=1 Tax=Riccia fluitans TaxID=41844 RepID=A0ABD1YUR0_9MARC
MAQGESSFTLPLLIVFCSGFLLSSSSAKTTHKVGGEQGWTLPVDPATFYNDWAANQTFAVDDDLLFLYEKGTQNVWVVTVDDLPSCQTSTSVEKYEDGNVTFNLYRSGDFAFLCQYAGHCDAGMKMKLTVQAPPPGSEEASAPVDESPTAYPGGEAPDRSESPPESPAPPDSNVGSAASTLQSLSGLLVGSLFTSLVAVSIL